MDKKGCDDDDDGLPLLPEDFFIKVLVRLPVKSLLRFKSVCISWCALIQSSFFIDLHTTTTTTTTISSSKFGTFILQNNEPSVDSYGDDIKMYMLSYGSGDDENNEDDDQKKKMVFKLDDLCFFPFYKDFLLQDSLRMVGSCNGIICLHDPEVMEDERGCTKQHYSNLRNVSLWNPATRQFRILPKSIPIEQGEHGIGCLQVLGTFFEEFVAFGFDVKTKDYKVLRITSFIRNVSAPMAEEGGCMCRVQVYSLSTDSWRLLDGIDSLPVVPNQHGIYLNGSYFIVGRKFHLGKSDSMILSFDFTKEIFTTMQLPDDNSSSTVLSCMGDKMAVFTTPLIDYDGGNWYYDIWVLNEQHGSSSGSVVVNKESWTKLHSFRIQTHTGYPYPEPRCISNNGEFALISTDSWTETLQLFNLVTKEAKKDFLDGTGVCRADVYKESLVSIMGGGNHVLLRWQLPTHGTCCYKLNLDAPFIDSNFTFGIGLCLTSDTGGCIGVRSLRRHDVRDAAEGEAMAMLEAIKWAKMLELSPIIIESDSKNCVSFFMDDDDDDNNNSTYWSSRALSLLREAKLLLLNNSELGRSISFQYCSRSCNYVADIAARLGREGFWTSKDWTANFPGEIVMSLSKDLGLESR